MRVKFNEKKATQIAVLLLRKQGGRMDILDLMKLIYVVDRRALLKWHWPLTGDRYAALERGMILSKTYDLAKGESVNPTFWGGYISPPKSYVLSVINDPGTDELSQDELALIEEICDECKNMSRNEMIENLHHLKFPEWENPGKSSYTVPYERVLALEGVDEKEVNSTAQLVEVISQFEYNTF